MHCQNVYVKKLDKKEGQQQNKTSCTYRLYAFA